MKISLAAGAVLVLGALPAAQAQKADPANYPIRPIRLLVPQAPGGSNDIMARYIGGQLAERLGRQVVVDNRPGAEGIIGTEMVARSAPDGYTLLMASTAFTMNPAVMKLPYDPVRDFDWAATLGRGPVMIAVGPSLSVNSLQELIALGKAKPNLITMASAGGFMHFVSAMFLSYTKIDGVIALYKGGAPALIDVMGGHAHMAISTVPTINPHIRSGKLKLLAISSSKRFAILPDLPTAAEAGLPAYDAAIWWAWAAAAGTPGAVLNRVNTEVAAILRLPDTQKRFALEGAEIEVNTPAAIRQMIKADLAKWEKVARDAGMKKQ